MGLARSTFYRQREGELDETALVERMHAIQGEFPAYGYRRITAQLRAEGRRVNRKRIARLMRLHGMQVRPKRRSVATTDSNHDGPIFPNLAKDMVPDGPDQLWVADLTYVAIAAGFVYLAVILDAWSRRVIGYALGRAIDARLTIAALQVAIHNRQPEKGCASFRSRQPIRRPALSRSARRTRPDRLDGAQRQSIRQRQGGKLHEDAQSGSGLPHGV
jgi:putative transposase